VAGVTVADVVHAHATCPADEHRLLQMLGLEPTPRRHPKPATVRVTIPTATHGRRATYVAGCGCNRCTAANTAYVAAWRRRGCCPARPVTSGGRLATVRVRVLAAPEGRGRRRAWPDQLALEVA
jgi:hypothetical protein